MSKWNDKSAQAWDNAWSEDNALGSSLGLLSGITGVIGAARTGAQTKDSAPFDAMLDNYKGRVYNSDNYFNLTDNYMNNQLPGIPSKKDLTLSTGEQIGNTLSATASGAMTGMQIGGPWGALIGGGVGLLAGGIGWALGDRNAQRESNRLNAIAEGARVDNINKFNYSAGLISDKMFNGAALNYRAYGGDLYDNAMISKHYNNDKVKYRKSSYIGNLFAYGGQMRLGGDWTNGVTIIGEGGTHETNPYDGVQVGVDDRGVPNLVEEGEVIFNDYVYSNRLKPTEKQLEEVGLCPSLEGKSFADIAKIISTESEERPNDPISKNGLIDGMMKLQAIQEDIRTRKAQAKFKREFNKLSPEEQQAVAMQMMQPQGMSAEEEPSAFDFNGRYAANGNPQDELNAQYGFAFGGNLFELGGIPYDNTKGFKYFNNGAYYKDYLDWLSGYDIENSPYWSKLQDLYGKYNTDELTVNKARELGQDKKFGPFHRAMQDMYEQHLADSAQTQNTVYPEFSTDANEDVVLQDNFHNDLLTASILHKQAEDNLAKITGQSDNNNIADDLLEQAEFSLRDQIEKIEAKPIDIQVTGKNTSVPDLANPNLNVRDNIGSFNANDWLRYAPAIGSGITAIADLFGANKPDYSKARMIGTGARRIRDMRAPQLYNYLRFNPYDVNYQQNKIQNVGLGTQRNILNTTSGNRAAALAGLLAGHNTMVGNMGNLYRSALEYNDNQRKVVSDFNRGTDQINLQSILTAGQANQNADVQRANFIMQQAKMMDDIDTATSAAISNNRSNFFKNLGNIGTDNYYKNQTDWLIRSGWVPDNEQTRRYPRKNGGKIRKTKRMI